MAEKEPVRWITVKGKHLPVYADGSIGVGSEDKSTDDFIDKDVNALTKIKSISEFGIQGISPTRDKSFIQTLSYIVNGNKYRQDMVINHFKIEYDDLLDLLQVSVGVASKDSVLRALGSEVTYHLFIKSKGGIQRVNTTTHKFESVGAMSDYWQKGEK